ncbi:peptidyl-prolyl cis-trans isomerase [Erythrobacter sp. GH1-10]|uniref:peptidylprolyl isomerase n=1 Tax=Erythrobacter sp. GH1-10 TaxID=3349334 RepID=UPI003877E4D4
MTFPGWTREPLVHFLLGGALLYALIAMSGGYAVDPASRVIEVGEREQAQLALQFERTMGRAPTDAELDAAIEQYVRDEVLYREALRLGLDQGDAVVRRRLVSKMDMAAGAAAEVAEPSEAQLREFLADNADLYAGSQEISFEQRYFATEAAARAALSNGAEGEAISLPASMEDASPRDIRDRFGAEFAQAVERIEAGSGWSGPVRSGFGWHVVRVTGRSVVETGFESIRPRLENDWRSAEIARRKAEAYQLLRNAYRVEIDR